MIKGRDIPAFFYCMVDADSLVRGRQVLFLHQQIAQG